MYILCNIIHIYIYTQYIYIYTQYIYIYTLYIHIYYIYIHVYVYTHMYTHTYTHIHIYTTYKYIHICSICIHTYCMCIYIYSTHFQSWLWDPSMQPLLWPPRYFECEAWGLAIARRVCASGLRLVVFAGEAMARGHDEIHSEWIGWTQTEYLGPLVSQSWKTCLLLPMCSLLGRVIAKFCLRCLRRWCGSGNPFGPSISVPAWFKRKLSSKKS